MGQRGPRLLVLARLSGIISMSCAFLSFSARSLCAQQNDLSAAASQMAAAINKSGERQAAVFDFVGPGKRVTPLGQKLADEFSAELAKSHTRFRVMSRGAVAKSFPEADLAPATGADEGYMVLAALDMGWDTAVVGSFTIQQGTIVLDIQSVRAERGDQIALIEDRIPISDELKRIIPEPAPTGVTGRMNGASGGNAGYSMPRCISCPPAVFPEFAKDNKIQGVVVLSAVIRLDGSPTDIAVVRAVPGLTTSAIRAVSTWKFQPGAGPDGNPAVVRTKIEVTFRLF